KIQGNFIPGNAQDGIYLSGASSALIAGTNAADRNAIWGNGSNGIFMSGGGTNTIQNNYIGTDSGGTVKQSNSENGIRILDSHDNIIGGTVDTARNVISGNTLSGGLVEGTNSLDNVFAPNYIGLDANGTAPLGNTQERGT